MIFQVNFFSCVEVMCNQGELVDCLQKIFPVLGKRLLCKGHIPYDQYQKVLNSADIVVSTAEHEFFGVAM